MSVVESFHADHGAEFTDVNGRRFPLHYGRPETAHRAVRNGVGVIEMPYGVVAVTGDDRVEYVDNVVSNRVPAEEGRGCYALLCDPRGRVQLDLYVYNAGSRLLLFTPPGKDAPLVEEWRGKVFIQDVEIDRVTDELAVFGVHGPTATEKVASVYGSGAPDGRLVFSRGRIDDAGVSVIAGDEPAGEESYEVICGVDDAEFVIDSLLTRGLNAVPFGIATWRTLTLEAGTPLFESELEGNIPNMLGLQAAVDYDKGCFIGQEVISRIHNRGRPNRRLVGLTCEKRPEPDAAVFDGDRSVGSITRAAESPSLEVPIALALVEYDLAADDVSVRVGGEELGATRQSLPFVEGSGRSGRVPSY